MAQRRALLLEDDPLNRNLFTDVMSLEGLWVDAYASPLHYLHSVQQEGKQNGLPQQDGPADYDYILTDKNMPGMSGLEFLDHLEEIGCSLNKQCIAIISGDWTESEKQQARDKGYRVLKKPYQIDDILDWIQESN